MEFLPKKEAAELRGYFDAHLTRPVAIDYFTKPASAPDGRECETCEDVGTLLSELSALSGEITLRIHDVSAESPAADGAGGEPVYVPAIALSGAAKGRVRFLGTPGGLEFGTLLRSLIGVATGATRLAETTREALRALRKDVHIRVFVTPTCPHCPRAAQTAVEMAVECERITAEIVEAEEFPELADRYRVREVPKTVINETVQFVGAPSEDSFLEHVRSAAA